MSTMTYSEAAKAALAEAMRTDPTVWAVGEDLGRGGVFGQYLGLEEEFGPERIVSAPISEAAIMGSAVGAALTGTRPIVELRFADFALCAVDEMVNQAAKARYMFGGQAKVPVVIRQPSGMWRSSAAQHSQMLEAWYAHIPGMVVLMPSTPADNYGLLKAAIGCDDPVVYMEHKDLWPLEGEVPEGHAVEIGKASIVREGSDATIVTWSAIRHVAAAAAERLSDDGISAEVIDLRSLLGPGVRVGVGGEDRPLAGRARGGARRRFRRRSRRDGGGRDCRPESCPARRAAHSHSLCPAARGHGPCDGRRYHRRGQASCGLGPATKEETEMSEAIHDNYSRPMNGGLALAEMLRLHGADTMFGMAGFQL
ncbi:MAG: transketolase C-terminal domain-containing protein, partial [Rickettsiales bacterium]